MMLIAGCILLFMSGMGLLVSLGSRWNKKELFSFSLLLGAVVQALFFWLCTLFSVQVNTPLLIALNVVWLLFFIKKLIHYFKENPLSFLPADFSVARLHYPAYLLWFVLALFFYFITRKGWYMPTMEIDAITSFDKLGIATALEGTLRTFLFQYGLQGDGGYYPPLFQSAIAYFYLFGAAQPKLITTFFYASLILGFYSFLKKITTPFGAVVYTFLLAFTPELFIHAGYLLGNMPVVAYAGLAAVSYFVFLHTNEEKYEGLSIALFIALLLTRQDAVVFVLPLVALFFLNKKNTLRSAIFKSILLLTPLAGWAVYQFVFLQFSVFSRFSLSGVADLHRWAELSAAVCSYFSVFSIAGYPSGVEVFGLSFIVAMVVIAADFRQWRSSKTRLLYWLLALGLYTFIYLLLNEKSQQSDIRQLLLISYKRGLLAFVPFLLFIAAGTVLSTRFFEWIDRWQKGEKQDK